MTQSASTKPYSDQAVITLVIAAREAWEEHGASGDDLDRALDKFSALVPYENEPDREALSPSGEPASVGEAGDPWSDDVGAFVDFGFTKVSRNPSDYETALAYRYAILAALSETLPASSLGVPASRSGSRGFAVEPLRVSPVPASIPSVEKDA